MSTNHAKCAMITPKPYEGEVTEAGKAQAENEKWSVIKAATYFDLPPLIVRRGDWAVSQEGVHCLYIRYDISKSRFDESDWIDHVTEKPWVDKSDFISIFEVAKDMVKLEMI